MTTGIAIVGCGYAADFYGVNFPNHPGLVLRGCYDVRPERSAAFAAEFGGKVYPNLMGVLAAPDVNIVVNLTPISAHVGVSEMVLAAGKHLYSEKPFTLRPEDATRLAAMATDSQLGIAVAPCVRLGESFQTLRKAIQNGEIGRPLYAECRLHDGMVHQKRHDLWISRTGAPWPAEEEFGHGCILEHAGYGIDLLVGLWGPIQRVSAESRSLLRRSLHGSGRDWGQATLSFANGCVASLIVSTIAPEERVLQVVGEDGVLTLNDVWRADSPIALQTRLIPSSDAPAEYLASPRILPVQIMRVRRYTDSHDVDHMAGVAELASAIGHSTALTELTARSVHALEATLAIERGGITQLSHATILSLKGQIA